VVGKGDGDGVDVLGVEYFAIVGVGLWGVAELFLGCGGELGEDGGVDVADVGDAGVFALDLRASRWA
jgi:hypothetical protein